MKKFLLIMALLLSVNLLAACDLINPEDVPDDIQDKIDDIQDGVEPDIDPEEILGQLLQNCDGHSDFVVVEGVCYPMVDMVSQRITLTETEVRATFSNSIQLMTDFVADLSGSTGLAILDRDTFEGQTIEEEVPLAGEEGDDKPENLIVKLTEEGFFEEVSFSDDTGFSVNISANPLALEIYGEFTVVVFEVDFGYDDPNMTFDQKVWTSFHAGGIYLIHNETGKMFATKEVIFEEHEYTEYEYHQRVVTLTVTLNEPVVEWVEEIVFDEDGNPVLDVDGNTVFETIEKPVLDTDGNPIIFSVGPIQTEMLEVPVADYFEQEVTTEESVAVLDAEGNPVLDVDGNPVYELIQVPVLDEEGNPVLEIVEIPVLDENGNPLFDFIEVPVLDEEGNPVFMESFDLEFVIEERLEIIFVESHAQITNGTLTPLAERFIQKIMEEYYNWNYYRVNDYMIQDYSFTYNSDYIFYVEWEQDTVNNTQSRIIKRVYFDAETSELVIANFIDISLAGFDECTIYVDPINSTVICDPWQEGNIKVYTTLNGLSTIEDTENLDAISLPNGELYFFSYQDEFIEELGYRSTSLYSINADGTLNQSYIELAEYNELCSWEDCSSYVEIEYYDSEGVLESNDYSQHLRIGHDIGDEFIDKADLYFDGVSDFTSTREECDQVGGCWYNKTIEIVDEDGNILYLTNSSREYYPGGEIPGFLDRYLMNENAIIEYAREQSSTIEICEVDIGCYDDIYIYDYSLNQNFLFVHDKHMLDIGSDLIQSIRVNEENDGVYEYSRTISSEVCGAGPCPAQVEIRYSNDEGVFVVIEELISVPDGDIMPLRIDYTITNDTTITYYESVCNSETCVEEVTINGELHWVPYNSGDQMYLTIDFADTDKELIVEITENRQQCTDEYGCYVNDGIYEIIDEDGEIIYTFENGFNIEYGHTAPYKVTLSVLDCEINYQKEYSETNKVCENDVCEEWMGIFIGTQEDNEHLGSTSVLYSLGDTIIQNIYLPDDSFIDSDDNQVCTNLNGCHSNTKSYIILDEERNILYESDDDNHWINVKFAYGEEIPTNDDYIVTYVMKNIEYRTQRIYAYQFLNRMREMERLDDNLYFVEKDSWSQGEYNFLMTFNEETNRYSVRYTNISAVTEITKYDGSYIAINDDKTAIIQFSFNEDKSDDNMSFYDEIDLTQGLSINGVNDLIVNYDGSVYFKGVDNFLNYITGYIDELNVVHIDTEYIEPVIVRVRAIN